MSVARHPPYATRLAPLQDPTAYNIPPHLLCAGLRCASPALGSPATRGLRADQRTREKSRLIPDSPPWLPFTSRS